MLIVAQQTEHIKSFWEKVENFIINLWIVLFNDVKLICKKIFILIIIAIKYFLHAFKVLIKFCRLFGKYGQHEIYVLIENFK